MRRTYRQEDPQRVAQGLEYLTLARDLFKAAGASKTVERIRLAISSAKGAHRHISNKAPHKRNCPDCEAAPGQPHGEGCDIERCSECGGQYISCGCAGHVPLDAVWSGEWPGIAECRVRGWYCQDGFAPLPTCGSFRPCDENSPGAMPDLNRLAHFKATGVDDIYKNDPLRMPNLPKGFRKPE